MNTTEQRRHATLAQKVEQISEDVTQVVDGMDARVFELARHVQALRRELNEFKVRQDDHAALLKSLRTDVDVANSRVWVLEAKVTAVMLDFHGRTFAQRLVWLFTGR